MDFRDNNELLKYFKEAITADASVEIIKLKNEINQLKFEEEESIINELKAEKKEILEISRKELSKKYQNLLSQKQRELDLALTEKRNQMFAQLMDSLIDKINKFQKTKEYKNQMINSLNSIDLAKFATIEFNSKDQFFKDLKIKTIENDEIIAGYKLTTKDGKIVIDQTYNAKIQDAKAWFYKHALWFKS